MKKLFILISTILMVGLLVIPAMADESGASGGMLGHFDEANTYGLLDTHAFHTVRGITVLNMTQGNGNVVSSEANIAAIGGDELLESTPLTVPAWAKDVNNGNALRKYNRIAAHAFHDVKGISMINMTSGNGNVVQSSVTVTVSADFMAATDVFFASSDEGHE